MVNPALNVGLSVFFMLTKRNIASPERCNVIYDTYFQNVTTLPCKIANNVTAHLEFCKSRVKHSDDHVHRIVNCIEQLTVN